MFNIAPGGRLISTSAAHRAVRLVGPVLVNSGDQRSGLRVCKKMNPAAANDLALDAFTISALNGKLHSLIKQALGSWIGHMSLPESWEMPPAF